MNKSVKVASLSLLSIVLVYGMMMFSGCGSSGGSSPAPTPPTTYSGTLYMASSAGGHIGVFPVTIDPSNTAAPITVDATNQTKIQLAGAPGTANSIYFHDVRFGVNTDGTLDTNKIYYSGMMSRGTNTSVVDIGYVDLTKTATNTNNGIDSTIDIDGPAADNIAWALSLMDPTDFGTGTRIVYCASGMTKDYYFPMSMSFPAFVDAVPVSAIATAGQHVTASTTGFHRTYINQIDADAAGWARLSGGDFGTPPLAFIHGASSPDGTKIYMSTNVVSGLSTTNNLAGVFRTYLVNASDLATGAVGTSISSMAPSKVISKASFTVNPSLASIAYRASFTPDGKYILQSGADRALILNANDLSLYVDTAATNANDTVKLGSGTSGGIEVHDVIATPDGKYAILAIRYFSDSTNAGLGIKTSGVQLYDINNKKFIGGVVSTCGSNAAACHVAYQDFTSRATCGVIFKSK